MWRAHSDTDNARRALKISGAGRADREVGLFLRVRSRHTGPLRSGRSFARIFLRPFDLRQIDKRQLSIGAAVVVAVIALLWFARKRQVLVRN